MTGESEEGIAMASAQLGPDQRRQALQRMRDEVFDILVIGGGITGSGAALDAATRGLSVALVEARDYAAGTSSRSSKLIHGGLRYLEQMNFGLVREALRERGLLLTKLAPHLVKPVPFIYPLTHRVWERFYVGTGIFLYDRMGGAGALPGARHLTKRKALELFPSLRSDSLIGGIQYYDAQVDDARHTLTVARTAAKYGAALATSARVTGLLREGERVVGARVRDLEGGEDLDVRARQVVNATGVWTDEIQELVGRGRIHVRASKGIHLVVPRDRIHADSGLILRTEKSVLFVIPWGRHWIIGTTDTDWNLDLAHPAANQKDIDYLLEHVNAVITSPLSREDVEGVYAGLRPLLSGESESTSKLSREHAVSPAASGLVSVAGGKYTTYRVMAEDAIDASARGLDKQVPASATDSTPLIGAEGYEVARNQRHQIAAESGLHVARVEHLLSRYGTRIHELLGLAEGRPELLKPLAAADDYLAVEVVYAAAYEGALHIDDVMTRRTRISIETFDRGVDSAEQIAGLIGEVLGWDEETRKREVEHYYSRVAAERESQQQLDDITADAARMGAPDVRMGAISASA
jgi:glycerol-3-phosphate dehydrogenase